jgi:integrase
MFPTIKANRLPITKNILQLITQYPISTIDDVNFDTTFKIAWAGFLRLDEITYTTSDLKKKAAFIAIKTTRSDISFAENDQYAILRLKRSKTDVNHSGVQIMLAATNETTCPVRALRRLFCMNPQPINAPLFRLVNDSGSFSRIAAIKVLKTRLAKKGINAKSYSGHSFRKGAAQHASDNDMLDENIQRLGR